MLGHRSGLRILLAVPLLQVAGEPDPAPERALALVGGTVHAGPYQEAIEDGVVLIEDGRITAVGRAGSLEVPGGVPTLDCSGLTVTAGFWNSHVHLFERKWADAAGIPGPELERQLAEMFTRHGFTSVFDTGSAWENTRVIRDRVESGEVAGPGIRSTGEPLIAPHAMPSAGVLGLLGFMAFPTPEVTDAAAAAAAARRLLEEGVDGIKLHLQPPPAPHPALSASAVEAAVAEAHDLGKPVFVHPVDAADVLAAVRAGVDVIAHTTPGSGPWDESVLGSLKETRVALTPTLTLWGHLRRHDRLSIREQATREAVDQLRAWRAAGGAVLFGTDAGANGHDPGDEYASMAAAGMDFHAILASLTTVPAERFGDARRLGRVDVGFQADLVVSRGMPGDVRALADVRYTIRGGTIVFREGR